jgi:low affinity Fe/Cu permease
MPVARVLALLVGFLLVALIVAYATSGNAKYLRYAKRLAIAVAVALFVFFLVLAIQNYS